MKNNEGVSLCLVLELVFGVLFKISDAHLYPVYIEVPHPPTTPMSSSAL